MCAIVCILVSSRLQPDFTSWKQVQRRTLKQKPDRLECAKCSWDGTTSVSQSEKYMKLVGRAEKAGAQDNARENWCTLWCG